MVIEKSGFLLVNKPEGITSTDVINKIKRKFKFRKIGHTGTLDPFASGLLILAINKATKFVEYLQKEKKGYQALIELGKISFSYDIDTLLMYVHNYDVPQRKEVENILKKFIGKYFQFPPELSAKRIKGERAYNIFRKERRFPVLKPQEVEIYNISLLDYDFPLLAIYTLVSGGTYIRALARDIGKELKTGGVLKKLRRVSIGNLNISQALNLEDILNLENKELEKYILPIDKALHFETFYIYGLDTKKFLNGNKILVSSKAEGIFKIYDKDNLKFLGIGEIKNNILKPVKVIK